MEEKAWCRHSSSAARGERSASASASAVDATARQILELIRSRGLAVGDALPTERELCELFGASRNTVREALRTIRTYGLIDARPRVGAVLTDRQSGAIQNFFAAQMDVSRSSFGDIQGFRRIIEVGIGDQLVLHAAESEIEALEAINARIEASRSHRGGRPPRFRLSCRADPACRQPHAGRDL